ncbi:MAG TPA: radical SAM protein [Tepidisphaeraceae bacterium]|nr:radical SAM protein [Tepidisphaeraceae bacterium]
MNRATYTRSDFSHSPMIVFYEVTRATNVPCQTSGLPVKRDPLELNTAQARRLIDELAEFPKPPMLALTGGDPLRRPDVFRLIEHAARAGVRTSLTAAPTAVASTDAITRLKATGLARLAVAIDGPTAAAHDAARNAPGSFDRTLAIVRDARGCDLSVQVNTIVNRDNADQLGAMADLLARIGTSMWSVFFLVPDAVNPGQRRIPPERYDQAFAELYEHAKRQPYPIKATEAPFFRRWLLQQQAGTGASPTVNRGLPVVRTNDGKGVMAVNHVGVIWPSPLLPIACGTFPNDSLVRVYQQHPLFRDLRDPAKLKGKCATCEFKAACGGSRARAFATTGDPLQQDGDCNYQPGTCRPKAALAAV